MVSLNIWSLLNKLAQVESLLEGSDLDALCINESWLCDKTPNSQIRFEDYKVYMLDRRIRKRGGGGGGALCAYIHYKYRVDALKYEMLNVSNHHIEMMTLEKCTEPFTVTMIYRPPQGSLDEVLDALKVVLNGIGTGNELFGLGDLNVDYLSQQTKAVRGLKVLEREFNLKQLITAHTQITNKTSTLLDYIYTPIPIELLAAEY